MLEKRNKMFVTGHRNGLLLFSAEKFLDYFCGEIAKHEPGSKISRQLLDVFALMVRATMNASHSNGRCAFASFQRANFCLILEVCAIKLGQVGNFLSNTIKVLTDAVPRYTEAEKMFDLILLVRFFSSIQTL